MALDKKMLAILVCPLCKGDLEYIVRAAGSQAAENQDGSKNVANSQGVHKQFDENQEAGTHQSGVKTAAAELTCKVCRLAFPIQDDIPIMLESEARRMPIA